MHKNFPYKTIASMIETGSDIALARAFTLRGGTAYYPSYANFVEFTEDGLIFDMIEGGRWGGSDETMGHWTICYESFDEYYFPATGDQPATYSISKAQYDAIQESRDLAIQVAKRLEEERAARAKNIEAERALQAERKMFEDLKKKYG